MRPSPGKKDPYRPSPERVSGVSWTFEKTANQRAVLVHFRNSEIVAFSDISQLLEYSKKVRRREVVAGADDGE